MYTTWKGGASKREWGGTEGGEGRGGRGGGLGNSDGRERVKLSSELVSKVGFFSPPPPAS